MLMSEHIRHSHRIPPPLHVKSVYAHSQRRSHQPRRRRRGHRHHRAGMWSFAFGLPAMGASLTLSPVAMGRARPAPAPAWRTASSGRCSRLQMLTPDTSGPDAPAPAQISDEARASLRLPAGSPYMNAASPPTAEEELQSLLDAPLLDPWSDTPDECSLDTPSGCMPG